MIELKCPNCGGNLVFNNNILKCQFCGTTYIAEKDIQKEEKVTTKSLFDKRNIELCEIREEIEKFENVIDVIEGNTNWRLHDNVSYSYPIIYPIDNKYVSNEYGLGFESGFFSTTIKETKFNDNMLENNLGFDMFSEKETIIIKAYLFCLKKYIEYGMIFDEYTDSLVRISDVITFEHNSSKEIGKQLDTIMNDFREVKVKIDLLLNNFKEKNQKNK